MNGTVAWITTRALLGRRRFLMLFPLPLLLVGLAVLCRVVGVDPNHWAEPVLRGLGFAVVLPRCGEREATRIARRLLEQTQRQLVRETSLPMPLDLGMSFYPTDSSNAAGILRAAEQRMLVPGETTAPAPATDRARLDEVGSW